MANATPFITQRTIAHPVSMTGVGLHSGLPVHLTIRPADIDEGICFIRTDKPDAPPIPARADLVTDTVMSSNLTIGDIKIGTVEHLLSALAGLGIDNAIIEVDASEIPIMDGSASVYTQKLLEVDIVEQSATKTFLKILKPVRVEQGDKWAELLPFDGFRMTFDIEFNHPAISKDTQHFSFDLSTKNFIEHIAKARTFGFMSDIEALKANGLAQGGSLDNAIVLDEQKIMNDEPLRYKDEFVRHKVLDAIGDLYLIGYPIIGEFRAFKSGHALNNDLVRTIQADLSAFEIVTKYDKVTPVIDYGIKNFS